jgi:hypothetical protein
MSSSVPAGSMAFDSATMAVVRSEDSNDGCVGGTARLKLDLVAMFGVSKECQFVLSLSEGEVHVAPPWNRARWLRESDAAATRWWRQMVHSSKREQHASAPPCVAFSTTLSSFPPFSRYAYWQFTSLTNP